MASVTWLGHASFEVNLDGTVIYLDPWFDKKPRQMNRLVQSAVQNVDDIKKADVIMVSHEHFDHCDPYDVTRMCQRTFATIVGPDESLANFKDILPRRKMAVEQGESFMVQGLQITVTPARHPQSINPVGYILEKGGKSVYFAGDTYEFPEMNNIDVDVALLPIGGSYTMDTLGAVSAVKRMQTSFAIPMHFNTFDRITVDPDDFRKRLKDTKTVAKVLQIGQTFEF